MSDKNKDLMIPRYEVMADYPSSNNDVGDIITDVTTYQILFYNKYPHLFKKLAWYERRKIEEMPEYVKGKDNSIMKVFEWHNKADLLFFVTKQYNSLMDKKTDWWNPRAFTPATESDYLTFKNQKDGK